MDTPVYFLNVFLTGANRLFWSDVESQQQRQPASHNYNLGNFTSDMHSKTNENGPVNSSTGPANNIVMTSEDSVNMASLVKSNKKSEGKEDSASTNRVIFRNKRFDYQRIFYFMKHVLLSEDKIPCLDTGVVSSKSLLLPDNCGNSTSSSATFPNLSYYSEVMPSSDTSNGSIGTAATSSENYMISMNKENTIAIVFKYYFYYHKSLKLFDKFLNNVADRECRLNPLLLPCRDHLVTFFYDLFVKETNIMLQSV